jgi:hypothetical protein
METHMKNLKQIERIVMIKNHFFLAACIAFLLAALGAGVPARVNAADTDGCDVESLQLDTPVVRTIDSTRCFDIGLGSLPVVLIRLEPLEEAGDFNLYFGSNTGYSPSDYEQLNRYGPIHNTETYAFTNVRGGSYTIGVTPIPRGSKFRLTVWAGGQAPSAPRTRAQDECNGNICTSSSPQSTYLDYVQLGGTGDTVIFPMALSCSGAVTAQVNRADQKSKLWLGIVSAWQDGPAAFARAEGGYDPRAPLRVSYGVTSDDLQRSPHWQVYLSNESDKPVRVKVSMNINCS